MTSNQSLKNELFNNLKSQGFQDQLKKQLRAKLIQKIKNKNLLQTKNQKKILFQRVLSSLIIQQLSHSQSSYTQSIYSIQSGFQNQHITRNQLIELLTFKQQQINQNESILQYILRKNKPFSLSLLQNIQIQTNPQQIGYTLEQKLMMVDQQYRMNLLEKENNNKNNIYDKKKFQLELLEKSKKQIDLFKQFETHKIKIKVSEEWRKKFEKYSESLAQQYKRKFQQLRKKDKALNQQYILKNNQLSLKITDAQNTIKQKLQILDMKNITIKSQMQNLLQSKKDFDQKSIKTQKQLNQKRKQYQSLTLNINQKIKYQVNIAKLAIQQQYQQKQTESLRRKKVIDQDYGKLMGIKDSINIVEKENQRLSKQNTLLRNQLTTLQVQFKNSVNQMSNKVQRIQILKDDLIAIQQQNKKLEQKNKQEFIKSKRYQSQILKMQQQLSTLRQKQNNQGQYLQSSIPIIDQSQIYENNSTQVKKYTQVNKRLQKLKNQRKKDIQKFKSQL